MVETSEEATLELVTLAVRTWVTVGVTTMTIVVVGDIVVVELSNDTSLEAAD